VVANSRCSPKVRIAGRAAVAKEIINEHGTVRDETVITDCDEITYERVRLDPASVTDLCSSLDLHEWSNEGVIADFAAVEVHRFYDDDIVAESDVHDTHRTELDVIHTAIANG
jgi:hypothetical protein